MKTDRRTRLPARPALAVVLLVGLGLTAALGTCSSSDGPSAGESSPKPSPTAVHSPPSPLERGEEIAAQKLPEETVEAVETGGKNYFRGWTEALADPEEIDPLETDELPGLEGAALEELLNTLSEYRENGWRVAGSPRVLRTRVIEATRDPDTVTVVACVDNSDVRLLDSKGAEIPNSRPPHPRTRNVMTLVLRGEGWVVGEQRPATRPNC